jgi:hypothetical protein
MAFIDRYFHERSNPAVERFFWLHERLVGSRAGSVILHPFQGG